MFNQNSLIVQSMINNGQFGHEQPMTSNNYNPYMNQNPYQQPMQYGNMIPVGQTNYNCYSYNYDQQNMNVGAQNNTNGFVFAPVQAKTNYYDPYGSCGYNNPYAYNQYGNNYYGAYVAPTLIKQKQREELNKLKIKYQLAGAFYGKTYTDEELDRMLNPEHPANILSNEERAARAEYKQMCFYEQLFQQPPMETNAMRTAKCLYDMSYNFHKEFDNHGLCQFLEEDLWKLQREQWIENNIVRNSSRNLANTYSSAEYNQLLNMHRSSNPYINELLDTSRYDNNLDDMEIGLPVAAAFDREARRRAILEGRVPSFISSDETQKRRNEWTNKILSQIYSKGVNT